MSSPAAKRIRLENCSAAHVHRRRRLPKRENLVQKLFDRQTFSGRPGTHLVSERQLHTCIVPNMTVVNVERPSSYLRKFTPDGKYLLAFSGSQTQLDIFEYRGVTAAGELLHQQSGVLLCHDDEYGSVEIRQNLFSTLFRHLHTVPLVMFGSSAQLNRECSLFTADSRHVIVGASGPCPLTGDRFPSLFEFYQNNESLAPTASPQMNDVTIFCVDIADGRVCDQKEFKCDRIALSHNEGLYLHDRLLCVLSVQHQTIHLFQVERQSGHLVPLQSIGRYLFDNDEMQLQNYQMLAGVPGHDSARRFAPMAETVFTGLKHRLMVFLYRQALEKSQTTQDPLPLRRFYQCFEHYRYMRIWRMQMLDSDLLLLRYAQEETIMYPADLQSKTYLLVIYNWRSTEVLAAYDNFSTQLMELYEKCSDQFRHPDGRVFWPCSVSSSQWAHDAHERYKRTICKAKGGGRREMVRRVLYSLPVLAQSFSSSPYLDLNLFSYDDKLVSMLERPKAAGDCAVRFYNRRTSQLAFQLHCGMSARSPNTINKCLVAFIFHPNDPLCISVQRDSRGSYIVNCHLPGAYALDIDYLNKS